MTSAMRKESIFLYRALVCSTVQVWVVVAEKKVGGECSVMLSAREVICHCLTSKT